MAHVACVCVGCADYYVIDGVRHDAYLYILYVNGAGPQKSWLELLARPLRAFFTLASSGWRKLLDGLSSDDDCRERTACRERGGGGGYDVDYRGGGGSRASSLSAAKDPRAAALYTYATNP